MFWYDLNYITSPEYIAVILAIMLAMFAQAKVSSTFQKFSKINSTKGYSGKEVARLILDSHGLSNIQVIPVPGKLTDHYDPTKKTIGLSENVYNSISIAAVSVAAHEVGHAIQDSDNYVPLKVRAALVPAVNFASKYVMTMIIFGFLANSLSLLKIGIAIFMVTVIFQIVTLPVEFNASRRALKNLENGILTSNELSNGKKVLSAAALTYVASALVAITQLIRLMSQSRRRR